MISMDLIMPWLTIALLSDRSEWFSELIPIFLRRSPEDAGRSESQENIIWLSDMYYTAFVSVARLNTYAQTHTHTHMFLLRLH